MSRIMNEIWKDIEGFEGLYQVSNLGRVKSLERMRIGNISQCYNGKLKERILKPGKDRHCYLVVVLYKDNKKNQFKVHRLVAKAFIPNPLNLPYINHKDENPSNNCVDNLEWCTQKYNVNYGTGIERRSKKLINNEKRSKKVLCVETNTIYPSIMEAERQTRIKHISCCCKGNRKTAGKFHWKYVN